MTDREQSTPPPAHAEMLDTQRRIRQARTALLESGGTPKATEALRWLFGEIIRRHTLWYDVTGYIATLEAHQGIFPAMVELVFCLVFPDAWPPEPPRPEPEELRSS